MDEKSKPLSFLDLLERMKSSLWAARKAGGSIEERQKSLTEQESSQDEAHPDDVPLKKGDED
jgi:hypothetical protein